MKQYSACLMQYDRTLIDQGISRQSNSLDRQDRLLDCDIRCLWQLGVGFARAGLRVADVESQ